MIAPTLQHSTPGMVQWKNQTGRDLYQWLLEKLDQLGPIQKTVKEISVALENRKVFASVLIRNRSIKLVLRTDYKITNPRILSMERVAEKIYDHTILVESRDDIDEELMSWLEEAYRTSNQATM